MTRRFTPTHPLVSVWPTGQVDSHTQLGEGGYVPGTDHDRDRILPTIAAHAITMYTRPGDTVVDPDCGAGTVLIEALRLARHAVGLTNRRWWAVARANITAAKCAGAVHDGMVLDTPPSTATAQLAGFTGRFALVLTALRPTIPGVSEPEAAPNDHAERLRQALAACRPLMRPGGYVVVTIRPRWYRDRLLDLIGYAHDAGCAAGFVPVERCVALLAALRNDRLIVRASLAQRQRAARREESVGHPVMLTAHHDVLVFRAPDETTSSTAVRPLQTAPLLRRHAADPQDHDGPRKEAA